MPADTLYLVRRHAPAATAALGYRLEAPAFELPLRTPTDGEDLAGALGWAESFPAHVRIRQLDATGLPEPSVWEQAWMDWLSRKQGAGFTPVPAPSSNDRGHHAALCQALHATQPWSGPDEVPEGVLLRRAETRRGEAVAAARQIRAWLGHRLGTPEAVAACERVLVLLPPDPDRIALWAQVLRDYDLPVRATLPRPLLRHPLAQWLVALAQLAGWGSEQAVSRAQLQAVLLPRWWSARAVLGCCSAQQDLPLRRLLRERLLELRRPMVSPSQLSAHLHAVDSDRLRPAVPAAEVLLGALAETLGQTKGLLERLLALVEGRESVDLGCGGAVSQVGGSQGREVWARLRGLLGKLVVQEQLAGGTHPDLVLVEGRPLGQALAALLSETLAGAATVEHLDPGQGITLSSYKHTDGREVDLLFLAGLGEGGFPVAPRYPGKDAWAWLQRLGALGTPDSWLCEELERQIRLACRAIQVCSGSIQLSFASEGKGTASTYPGPLLAMLCGGWSEQIWSVGHPRAQDFPRAAEVPTEPSQARSWGELSQHALHLQPATALPDEPQADQLQRLAQIRDGLATSTRAQAQRRPPERAPQTAKLGAYTGRLAGPVPVREPFSPTALEDFGQCPYRYFLKRVMGLDSEDEASEELASTEAGSAVHLAFARATWAAVEAAPGRLWQLSWPEGDEEAGQRVLEEALRLLGEKLPGVLSELGADAPTLCQPLVTRIGQRWTQAIENWVRAHIRSVPPAGAEYLDMAPAVAKALASWRSFEGLEAAVDAIRDRVEAGEVSSQPAAGQLSPGGVLTKTLLAATFKSWKGASESERPAIWDGLKDLVRCKQAQAEQLLFDAREREQHRRDAAMARNVAFAELAFGFEQPTDGPDPMADSDPSSVRQLLTLEAGGQRFGFRGEIDRVDLDPDRETFAIRDYKSGQATSAARLEELILDGVKLQLTLYALALQTLVEQGHLPSLRGCTPVVGALEHPKTAKPTGASGAEVSLAKNERVLLNGSPSSLVQVSAAWTGRHVQGIRKARFQLLPAHCPLSGANDAYCDFRRFCGYDPDARGCFAADLPDPEVELLPAPPKTSRPKKVKYVDSLAPTLDSTALDPAAARQQHTRAQERALDLGRDVIIAAGAGTGKTYNLVLRYLQALVGQGEHPPLGPQQVLCVTFTRRAAAELAHRLRGALLSAADDLQGPLVKQLRRDPRRFRQTVLSLSSAPISTIDSLALRIVQEAAAIEASRLGTAAAQEPEVVDPSSVTPQLLAMVSERFLAALERHDPRLELLLDQVTPTRLREQLVGVVAGAASAELRDSLDAAELEQAWWQLAAPLLQRAADAMASLDLTPWEGLLDDALSQSRKPDRPNPEKLVAVEIWLERTRALQAGLPDEPIKAWQCVAEVLGVRLTQDVLGKNELYRWLNRTVSDLRRSIAPPGTEAAELLEVILKLIAGEDDQVQGWAHIAAAAVAVGSEWAIEVEQQLDAQGTLRYSDVERRALSALRDPALTHELRQRLPFTHIFVDETQDTSERQVQLVRELARLCGSNIFWVGDVKQSIYRFRGAEVDVFRGLVGDRDTTCALTVNRRSLPGLIRSFNRFFGALLPCRTGDYRHDPAAEMSYEPLTWPEAAGDEDERPCVELLAMPGKGWPEQAGVSGAGGSTPDGVPEDDGTEDEASPAPLALALVRRVQTLLQEQQPGSKPDVAILVHSWKQATDYRDLLRRFGVSAVVQGGRGLLETPEVDHAVQWIEAALREDDLAVAGVLRGAGVALSDDAFACLRFGWGLRDDVGQPFDGRKLKLSFAAQRGRLHPSQAVEDWSAQHRVTDPPHLEQQLRLDAQALERFQVNLQELSSACQQGRVAAGLRALLDRLGLWAWWGAQPDGRQRVANLHAFVELLQGLEQQDETPLGMLRRLDQQRGSDDPAAGGLGGSTPARVCITTFWQAKGMEWPSVVLPDLHKCRISLDPAGFASERLVLGDGQVRRLPGAVRTLSAEPFAAPVVPFVKGCLDLYRLPAERAELRRLLYVAMTRAEQRLVLTGVFERPRVGTVGPGDGEDSLVATLGQAKSWASLLLTTIGLHWKDDGTLSFEAGTWTDDDLLLLDVEELAAQLEAPKPTPPPKPALLAASLLDRLHTVDSAPRQHRLPSAQVVDRVPPSDWQHGERPRVNQVRDPLLSANDEGTAIHGLFEAWAYGAGAPLSLATARGVIDDLAIGARVDPDRAARIVHEHVEKAVALCPPLCAQLAKAASRGWLYHEVPIAFRDASGAQVEGSIDLLWKDERGWSMLDYKSGVDVPLDGAGSADGPMKHHYAQVALYAQGFRVLFPEEALVQGGIWYTRYGLVLGWGPRSR